MVSETERELLLQEFLDELRTVIKEKRWGDVYDVCQNIEWAARTAQGAEEAQQDPEGFPNEDAHV